MAIFRRRLDKDGRATGPLLLDTSPAVTNARSITAAAMPVTGPGVKLADTARGWKHNQDWQREAFYYFDVIGKMRSALVWIAQAVSQADVHATKLDPDTGKPTGPADDPLANSVALQVLGGPAQRAGLLRTMALCWQIPGELWILVLPRGKGQRDEWLVLPPAQVKRKGTGVQSSWTYRDPKLGMEVDVPPQARLFRVWCPHPADSVQADSAVRAVLPDCREVERCSQTIAAQLSSRLTIAGLMVLASELDYPRGDHETTALSLMDDMLMAQETAIQNPGAPSALVPIAFNAPSEMIASGGAAAFIQTGNEFVQGLDELRDKALLNVLSGLDMPKAVSTGTQDESNHWSAWQVEESTYKIIIEPLLVQLGDAFTTQWFRPALVASGMDPAMAETYELGWDTTAIVARPDARETLESLYDKILISDEYMLAESGVPEDAMPNPEERTRRVLEKIVIGAPTLLADPAVAAGLGIEITVDPAAAGVGGASAGDIEGTEAPESTRALPTRQESAPEPEGVPDGLVAAAELIVFDALNRVGGRLLTNQNRGRFKDVPRHEIHTVAEFGPMDTDRLMEGSFQFVAPVAEAFGLDAGLLKDRLEDYVTRRLVDKVAHDRGAFRSWLR